MTKEQAIEAACITISMVYHTRNDYSEPTDGFCKKCDEIHKGVTYQNSGETAEFIFDILEQKLLNMGLKVDPEYREQFLKCVHPNYP